MKKVIKLTEADLTKIVKRVIKEQDEVYNGNMAIQCFLNKIVPHILEFFFN